MLRYKQILLFNIALLWLSLAFAQDPQPAWRNYNTDHGLASSEVYVAMQDSKGYMWFGSDNGLSRFDGYGFQNYGPTDGLQNNVVFDLQEDQKGRIWIMTMSGNAYYHFRDSIYPFQYNDTIQLFKDQFRMGVHLYFDDSDGSLYVTLMKVGILQIKTDGTYHLFRGQNPRSIIVIERNNKILYAHSHQGKAEIESRRSFDNWLKRNHLCIPLEFHKDTITSIMPTGCSPGDLNGDLTIVEKLSDGNFIYVNKYHIVFVNNNEIVLEKKYESESTNFLEDEKGAIFQCQNQGFGVAFYDNLDALKEDKKKALLSGFSVVNMTQDVKGGYWFTTLEQGVFYTSGLDFQIYDENNGFSTSFIKAFDVKNENNIFVGLINNDINYLNSNTHQVKKLPRLIGSQGFENIYYDHKTDQLWAGGVLQYLEKDRWRMIEFNYDNSEFLTNWPFKDYFQTKDSNYIWSIAIASAAKIELNSKSVQLYSEFEGIQTHIFSGYEDLNEQVWFGKIDGLWQLQKDTLLRPEIMHPSFYHRIEAIKQLPDSTLVIGTKGRGIVLWKDKWFKEITEANGLTSDMIENIYVDEKGVIWVGTLLGLNKIVRQWDDNFVVENITANHGLPSNEINQVKVINDEVWVATTKGLVRFPYDFRSNLVSDPPFFEAILINDEAIDLEKSNLTFLHQQNNISFHFLIINYHQNGKIPYRYRLVPAQSDWKETQNREVSYPALDNGAYTFEVQSQNEDGIWSSSTTYDFKIWPPWWETWWAISLGILALAGIGFGFYKRRTKQLEKEVAIEKQMTEVERQALRSQMNPHFIFNALNAIQGYIAQGDKLAANRYLSRFSKLIRSALQHSRVTKVPLEDDLASLKNYLELEQMRFKGGFDFQIKVADEIDTAEVTIPPMLIQPFVENAIVHGLANKEGNGKIDIDFQRKNDKLFITVTDNGIGIETSKKLKAGIASSHKSVGMTITKHRLEMLSGNGENGNVKIEELKDELGNVTGTKVSLNIPIEE